MFTLFLFVALCADPVGVQAAKIPDDLLDYFERADKFYDVAVQSHEDKITGLEISIRGDGNRTTNARSRRDLILAKKNLSELKKVTPFAPLPNWPALGDIGRCDRMVVKDVLDDHSVLVGIGHKGEVALIEMATKSLKKGEPILSSELWRVTSNTTENEVIRRRLTAVYFTGRLFSVLEPVKKAELDKYRVMYEAEKKQNAAPPAGIKDEKPKLDKAPMPDKPQDEPAAPLPMQVREYFKRSDLACEELTKGYELQISDLEIAIRGEPNPAKVAKHRRELTEVNRSFDASKNSKVPAHLPRCPAVGDIGVCNRMVVQAVLDDNTLLLEIGGYGEQALVTSLPTKSLKTGQSIPSEELWRVTSKTTDNGAIVRRLKKDYSYQKSFSVLEPVKKDELDKYRAQYEAEKKQNAAPPAGIKDEKPKLDKAPMPDKPKGNASEK